MAWLNFHYWMKYLIFFLGESRIEQTRICMHLSFINSWDTIQSITSIAYECFWTPKCENLSICDTFNGHFSYPTRLKLRDPKTYPIQTKCLLIPKFSALGEGQGKTRFFVHIYDRPPPLLIILLLPNCININNSYKNMTKH